jgi:hypothetical protein
MHTFAATAWSLALCAALVTTNHAQELTAPAATPDEAGMETLTRGPVHEAFAAPTAGDPQPGPVVPKGPPAEINEEPPAIKPDGAIWVPGYWEWDDELKDFLWVSGSWRVPPPGMRWVPPYWTEADGGWRRVPGFWISADAGELDYRPAPPATLEAGPASPAPADNYFWIPGTWTYYDTGYRWRTGYWSPYQTDWVWVPSRWSWTPAGCVYLPGFWDFRLAFRGQLFAPVYFQRPIYTQPNWCYRPRCVLDPSRLLVHLWIRPSCGAYYFGNYYGPQYKSWNLTPWCHWQRSRGHHDPLLSWCSTHYRRQGIDYVGRMQSWHDHHDAHDHDRPPRTWNEQKQHVASGRLDPKSSQSVLANDLGEVAKRNDLPIRLTKLDDHNHKLARTAAIDIRKLHTERLALERDGNGDSQIAHGDLKLPARGNSEGVSRTDRAEPKKLSLPKLSDAAREAATATRLPAGKMPLASAGADRSEPNSGRPEARLSFPSAAERYRGLSGGSSSIRSSSSADRGDSPKVPKITLPALSQPATTAFAPKTETRPKFSSSRNSTPKFSIPSGSERSVGNSSSAGSSNPQPRPGFSFPSRISSSSAGERSFGSTSKPLSIPKIETPRSSSSSGSRSNFSAPRIEIPKASSSSGLSRGDSSSSRSSSLRVPTSRGSSGGGISGGSRNDSRSSRNQ